MAQPGLSDLVLQALAALHSPEANQRREAVQFLEQVLCGREAKHALSEPQSSCPADSLGSTFQSVHAAPSSMKGSVRWHSLPRSCPEGYC